MEGCSHDLALSHQNRITVFCSENFDIFSGSSDPGSTNKDHLQRFPAEFCPGFTDGTVDLAAIGIASYANVKRSQRLLWWIFDFLGQQDCPCTGAKGWLSADKVSQFFQKSTLGEEVQEGAGLATGNDDGFDGIELLGLAHQHDLSAQTFE